jgi:hypothetical protein
MNKNILLVSVEFEIGLCVYLAKELLKLNYNPIILVADSWTLVYSKENLDYIVNSNTDIKILTIDNILKEINSYHELITPDNIDWYYLDDLNNRIQKHFTLLDLLRCDVGLLDDYHDYGHFNYKPNKYLLMKYFEISAKFVEKILFENNVSVVFSYNNQGFFKPLVYSISKSKNIKYIAMLEARIDNLNIFSDTFGLGFSSQIKEKINKLKKINYDCPNASKYIKNYCQTDLLPYISHQDSIVKLSNTKNKLKSTFFKYLIWSIYRGQYIHRNSYKYRFKNYFLPTFFSNVMHFVKTYKRINDYLKNPKLNKYFLESQLKNLNYVYFALHKMPENSASVTSKNLYEDSMIFDLSRKLPPSWFILVKIPPGMITMEGDTREVSWYLRIEKIPNVFFVSPFTDSKMLIKYSKFVASISGTVLLEAQYFNKYGIRWGNPEFCDLPRIKKIESIDEILAKDITEDKDIKYYVESIFESGISFSRMNIEILYKNLFFSDDNTKSDTTIHLIANKLCETI